MFPDLTGVVTPHPRLPYSSICNTHKKSTEAPISYLGLSYGFPVSIRKFCPNDTSFLFNSLIVTIADRQTDLMVFQKSKSVIRLSWYVSEKDVLCSSYSDTYTHTNIMLKVSIFQSLLPI